MILSAPFYSYHFARTILSIPFCPMTFCPYAILSIPFCPIPFCPMTFCPYHFVHTVLSNDILSVCHFVHTILSVPFCPLPFCHRTPETDDKDTDIIKTLIARVVLYVPETWSVRREDLKIRGPRNG